MASYGSQPVDGSPGKFASSDSAAGAVSGGAAASIISAGAAVRAERRSLTTSAPLFSVAFVFVDLKKRGILRRLRVTPINPNDFIIAQVITRLLVLLMQIVVLVATGVLFFHLNFSGNLTDMFLIGLVGAIVFLAIGFAIAGISKSEEQVAPLANIVTLPMLLLSGVFFSRSNLPGFVHAITDYFPLTFLADGLRSIAIDGAKLQQLGPQLAGLGVWAVFSCILAVRLFRWE